MSFAAVAALALGAALAQSNRPSLGPSAQIWLWAAPGLVEAVAPGQDERDLFLCGLSTDLRPRVVQVRALGAGGEEIGRQAWELPIARPVEFPLESLFPPGATPRTETFTLLVGALEASPGWLVISLRSESAGCGVDHPAGMWVQADPAVARLLLPAARPGGS